MKLKKNISWEKEQEENLGPLSWLHLPLLCVLPCLVLLSITKEAVGHLDHTLLGQIVLCGDLSSL